MTLCEQSINLQVWVSTRSGCSDIRNVCFGPSVKFWWSWGDCSSFFTQMLATLKQKKKKKGSNELLLKQCVTNLQKASIPVNAQNYSLFETTEQRQVEWTKRWKVPVLLDCYLSFFGMLLDQSNPRTRTNCCINIWYIAYELSHLSQYHSKTPGECITRLFYLHVSFYSYFQYFKFSRLQPYIYKLCVNVLTSIFMRSVTLNGWIQHSCAASFQFLHYNLILAQQKLFITQG